MDEQETINIYRKLVTDALILGMYHFIIIKNSFFVVH